MIQQPSFLGIDLRSRRRRRVLVLAYYFCLVALVAVPIYLHKLLPGAFVAQVFLVGGLFGGIKAGGPVKPYSERIAMAPDRLEPISLNLSGARLPFVSQLLDEREIEERDRAHYYAYRILTASLGVIAAAVGLALVVSPGLLRNEGPTLLWLLTIYALSLPQSVILWTEPEPLPDGELALVAR